MPKKFIDCVRKVMKKEEKKQEHERVNPYAVCRKSTGYYGTSHNIGLLKPIVNKKSKKENNFTEQYLFATPNN